MKKMFVLLVGAMLLAGCATTGPQKSAFLGEYYEKMAPGPEKGAKMRWAKPTTDFAKYNKFMVDYVVFSFAADSEDKTIDGEEMKKLGDIATLGVIKGLGDKYPVVTQPGPDVVRLRFAIVDLKKSRPVLSGITTIVPIGLAVSAIKYGTTDAWTGSGLTKAELMVQDSTTNEVIAVAYDEYAAGFTERFSKWGSVEDAFKSWGERIKIVWDGLKFAQ